MFRATIRSLLTHKLRLALTALAIILGTSFVSGTLVLTATLDQTFDNLFADVTEGVDAFVRGKSAFDGPQSNEERPPLPASLLEKVQSAEGVAVAEGSVTGIAQIIDKEGEAIAPFGPPTLGASWTDTEELSPFTLREGEAPGGPTEVVIDAGTAKEHDFQVGDRVEVVGAGPVRTFTLAGIAGFGDQDNLGGATLALFDLSTAQQMLDRENEFDAIEIVSEAGVQDTEVQERVAQAVGSRYDVATGTQLANEQAEDIQEGLSFFNTALLVFAGIALFVGSFIIANTFSIIVAQRTRELALLRAVGASRGQVLRSILVEAGVTGVLASAMGIVAGIGLAVGLRAMLNAFGAELPQGDLVIRSNAIIVPMIVGVIVTLVSSIGPARRATRVPPVAALRDDFALPTDASRRRTIFGAFITPGGAAVLMWGLFAGGSNAVLKVGLGALLVFIGVASLAPLVARPMARVIGAPIARSFGVAGRLARDNSARNPRRTASTAAALMIGLALVTFVAVFGASISASSRVLFNETATFDYTVQTSNFVGFPTEVEERIGEVPGVDVAAGFRSGVFRLAGEDSTKFLDSGSIDKINEVLDIEMVAGAPEAIRDSGFLVGENEAEAKDYVVGDRIKVRFPNAGTKTLQIKGIYERNPLLANYFLALPDYERYYDTQRTNIVVIRTDPGAEAKVRPVLERATEIFPTLEVMSKEEMLADQEEQIDQLLGMLAALLGLALIIAFIGIANTLALSIFERTREIGMLRAIGMSRRQVRRMVRWEAVIVALLGAVLGLVVGVFFGWAMVTALRDEGITVLDIPGARLIVSLVIAGVAGIAAAVFPARRAARLDMLRAITTE
jgi:putative ABC transport system permease protein